jgi:hypothetical protein
MQFRFLTTALALGAVMAVPARAGGIDVGVSIGIRQPGVYGRIDIGRFPQPQLVYAQPVIVSPQPVVIAAPQPVYMWVPADHRKHWRQHCRDYGACGAPVVFVRDDWYRQHVYAQGRGGNKGYDRGHGKDHGKDRGHDN